MFEIGSNSKLSISSMTALSNDSEIDGAWNYRDRPVALMHNGILYYCYITEDGRQYVASYDSGTGSGNRSMVMRSEPDLHNNPAIFVDSQGHINVFVYPFASAYQEDVIRWRRSENPEDVTSFGDVQTATWEIDDSLMGRSPTYLTDGSDVYLQINVRQDDGRGDRAETLWISNDDGQTWDKHYLWNLSPEGTDVNRSYTTAWIDNGDIHFVATSRDLDGATQIGYGVFYARFDPETEEFFAADATKLFDLTETPITDRNQLDAVWTREDEGNNEESGMWSDIKAIDGNPYITFSTTPNDDEPAWTRWWTRPENGTWEHYEINGADYALDYWTTVGPSAFIDPRDPTRLFVDEGVNEQGVETRISEFVTDDGGVTWSSKGISESGEDKRHFPNAVWGIGSSDPIEVVWMEGVIDGWPSWSTSVEREEQ